jgi:hypothetical protein
VVLPHPPFWLAIEIILIIASYSQDIIEASKNILHHDRYHLLNFIGWTSLRETYRCGSEGNISTESSGGA